MIAIFPEIAGSVAVKDFEMLAVLVRKYFGGDAKFHPRICLESLVQATGIRLGRERLDYEAALVAKDEKGRFEVASILSERSMSEVQRRFLLAHQLGHYFLHVQPHIARGEWRASGFTETTLPGERYEKALSDTRLTSEEEAKEKDADEFAACLLMPLGMTKKAQAKLGDVDKLAEFFGVSNHIAMRRLETISGGQVMPQNFIAAEKEIGSKTPTLDSKSPSGTMMSTEHLAESIQLDLSAEARPSGGKSFSGMDRIRQLARKIDSGFSN